MDQILNTMRYSLVIAENPIRFGEENTAVGGTRPTCAFLESKVMKNC